MRLFAIAAISGLLAVAGVIADLAVFGAGAEATVARLEREVRQMVASRTAAAQALADAVAAEAPLIAAATTSHDSLAALFERLLALSPPDAEAAATVYVPTGGSTYRILAWSSGAGEQALSPERLSGPASLFVAPGRTGLRLLLVRPLIGADGPIANIVTEAIIASNDSSAPVERRVSTSFGPVTMVEQYALPRDDVAVPNSFTIESDTDAPLLRVQYEPAQLAERRASFRRHALAVALLPLALALGLGGMSLVDGPRPHGRSWLRPALTSAGLLVASAAGLAGLAVMLDAPPGVPEMLAAGGLLGAAVIPGAWWWRPRRRLQARDLPLRFAAEQLLAGVILAVTVEATARLLTGWITPETLGRWQFVLFPFDGDGLLAFGTRLLTELALAWNVAFVVATLAGRWRLWARRHLLAVALVLWVAPSLLWLAWPASHARDLASGALVIVTFAVAFMLTAPWLRRQYRHTTQSARLVLGLLALLVPLLAFYPMGAAVADRAARQVIEHEFAPAIADHPQQLRAELARAQQDIDRLAVLPDLVSAPPVDTSTLPPLSAPPLLDTRPAFLVWRETSLARTRVISDVELYGPEGTLVSRFAFNLPEYVYRTSQTWQPPPTPCGWDVFGEVAPFGAEARLMLHATRGVCDAEGRLQGGIVVHVASNDYQALPFVASLNPYIEMLGATAEPPAPRLPDLQVVVYGWSFRPIFSSGPVTWAVPQATFERLYDPGVPFWTTLEANGRQYHVHWSQNRAGIYALGYPSPTLFGHASRLAEIAALTAVFFVVFQLIAMLSVPFTRRAQAPLGRLFHEIRTSYYRKLFLFFVAVAIVPVLVFALAFGSYMTARFRADVEFEAKNTVTVARRVFEELAAADQRTTSVTTTDDVTVWIRQVIGQDVNLFEGAELVATSQGDLFASGLLPTRTPASVYHGIALERLPTAVVTDRVGDFEYLVAAAPVSVRGETGILTVPLAPRQREIEREADELNRGVLVGAVLVVLLAAGLGASVAGRIADPVARLTRATRQIAAGELDVRIAADTADELRRLVDDFNSMAATLGAQRKALARTNQLKAWNEMARQVAHEIKNPLTPIQLAAEHLQHVHEDRGRPLGPVMDQCLEMILGQVRLLRQIASEFSNFAGEPTPRPEAVDVAALVESVVAPYRQGLASRVTFDMQLPDDLPLAWADRTLLARAITNLVENAVQAMPEAGRLVIDGWADDSSLTLRLIDTGVGMDEDALARAFEPFFSTKTGGSGLGLANARRNIEIGGGAVSIASAPGVGTTVTVSLPLASARDGSSSASGPSR